MCCDINGAIGCSDTNSLPWYVPLDLRYFKKITIGQSVIMGYNTYRSLGKPLSGRDNHVLSNKLVDHNSKYVNFHRNLEDAIFRISYSKPDNQVFLIGGAKTLANNLHKVNRIYLTVLDKAFNGDIHMPDITENGEFIITDCIEEVCPTTGVGCLFSIWERLKSD